MYVKASCVLSSTRVRGVQQISNMTTSQYTNTFIELVLLGRTNFSVGREEDRRSWLMGSDAWVLVGWDIHEADMIWDAVGRRWIKVVLWL